MLKIVTLNLNYHVSKHGPWPERRQLIVEALKDAAPDIIAFQAVAKDPQLDGGLDQANQICRNLPGFQYHYFQPAQEYENGRQEGSAVISRIPMLEADSKKLSLRKTDDTSPRVLLKTAFELADGPLYLFNGHFSWVDEQATDNVNEALPFMNSVKGRAILAGDLNTPPDSPVFSPLSKAGWSDAWKQLYKDKEGFTFESNKLFTRIDYFWLNQAIKEQVRSVEILKKEKDGQVRFSDHLGLMTSLDLKVK